MCISMRICIINNQCKGIYIVGYKKEPIHFCLYALLGVTLFDFHQDLWCQKTRVHGYCVLIVYHVCNHVDTILACNRQTDGCTDT